MIVFIGGREAGRIKLVLKRVDEDRSIKNNENIECISHKVDVISKFIYSIYSAAAAERKSDACAQVTPR